MIFPMARTQRKSMQLGNHFSRNNSLKVHAGVRDLTEAWDVHYTGTNVMKRPAPVSLSSACKSRRRIPAWERFSAVEVICTGVER
jgi:hypothetical protein